MPFVFVNATGSINFVFCADVFVAYLKEPTGLKSDQLADSHVYSCSTWPWLNVVCWSGDVWIKVDMFALCIVVFSFKLLPQNGQKQQVWSF